MPPRYIVFAAALVLVTGAAAQAQDGAAVFRASCATCHAPGDRPVSQNVPSIDALRRLTPEATLNVLLNGKMRIQATPLSDADRRAVAEYLGGRPLRVAAAGASVKACAVAVPFSGPATSGDWNGWGSGPRNTRFAAGGLTASELPRLKLKWAFGYADVTSARAQPALVGNRLFVASDSGDVHALDPQTGCAYWSFRAQATVRTALLVAPYTSPAGQRGWALLFGDLRANAYAVDAATGQSLWTRKVDDHPYAAVTGSIAYYDGRVFVPVQGLNEEVQGGRPDYECCTFRGSVSALDANTGAVVWKTYTVAEKQSRGANTQGKRQWGPAGGGIWSSPTVDARRGALYVSTGNGYADPSQPMTNAVIALDLQAGKVRWVNQLLANDAWTLGCKATNPDNPNCPAALGPDYDFSASPALASIDGRELLVLPQKSGMTYALDPDKQGALVWQHRVGQGSGRGGQWGGAVDDRQAYFGVGDSTTKTPGGMVAVKLATGERVWHRPAEKTLCGAPSRDCNAAQGAAVTAMPGAVLSGSYDGGLRAYAADDGSLIWQFDTNREFETVNGVKANGGSMDGPGPIVAGKWLFVNAGYGGIVGRPGNVLLAFGVD